MSPPETFANAGGGPVLGQPTVTNAGGSNVSIQVNSANGVAFDSLIIAANDPLTNAPGGASYIQIDFNPAVTSASLLVAAPPGFNAHIAGIANSQLPAIYQPVTITPPAPPPSGPAVQNLLNIPAQAQVIGQQLIQSSPLAPRPNPGGCACPILGPATVTAGSPALTATRQVSQALQTTAGTVTVHLATTNAIPFNRVIVTAGDLVGATPQASSYFLVQLAAPTTSMSLVLEMSAASTFTAQFAVTTNSEPPSNYVAAVLTPAPAGPPIFAGTVAATPTVTFGSSPCQYTQQFTNIAVAIAITQSTVSQSEITATGIETVLAGCATPATPQNAHRFVLQASAILLNGTSIKITYSQPSGQPGVALTFDGRISGNVITGNLLFRRADNPSLPWTITAPITLNKTGS
jgi:hypothetical protein